jgi:hypothetical protein
MRLSTFISFTGFVMLIAACYCPILRPLHVINWDVFDASKPYGIVILLVATVGIIGAVFNQVKITRFAAWSSLVLVVLFYMLAQLKIHTSFSFIPFHAIENFLARQIKFKWGWYLLFVGPLLALLGAFMEKKKSFK